MNQLRRDIDSDRHRCGNCDARLWFAENSAAQAALGRVRTLVSEWQTELDSGAIRDESARYCWGAAVRELRRALGDE